ncbi:hypothetical protein MNBD_BACTEROID07-48 [hydrothermal vent metagenome]|uniref:Uncharacterized protein n=1 Tax=hydrothermal vent metagenome TaxID=652676 RepID=A0A3B0UJA0_9ZZZZ
MKVKIFFTAILLSGLVFSSGCGKIKSLLDVKFDANYTVNLNMSVPAASSTLKSVQSSFEGSATVDPTSNSDVSKYLNLIKSWTVNSITGTFNNVTKEAVLQNGTLTFTSDAGTASWTFTNVQIKNGGTITIDNTSGQLDELSKILSAKKVFTVSFTGTTDKDDFTFTLSLEINSTVVANPLGSK